MTKIPSYILDFCIFVGGVVVSVLSDNCIVMYVGIAISFFTLVVNLLTMKDIRNLQEMNKHVVYTGEIVGVVPDGDYDILRELFKKTNSET